MRKIFVENLPKEKGIEWNRNKDSISWQKAVGCKVAFIYNDIEGYVEIVDYKKRLILCI